MIKTLCLIFGLLASIATFADDNLNKATAEGYKDAVQESQGEPSTAPLVKVPDPKATLPPAGKIPQNLLSLGDGDYFSKFAFVADKSTRTLTIWRNESGNYELLAAHPFDMGKKEGDKQFLGDLKTPEGVYFFNKTYRQSELDYNEYGVRAFVTDYPNFFDRMEQKTGSGIWLHAIPPTKTLKRGSRGCLVLRNEAIEKVEPYVNINKTPLIVEDKVVYNPTKALKNTKQGLLNWLSQWKKSWETKELDNYISYYHDDFKAKKMNKDQWRRYKAGLNEKYGFINVKIFTPVVFKHKNEFVVKFLQRYQSDTLADFGEKVLYIKSDGSSYKIVGEDWSSVPSELVAKYHDDECSVPGC